VNLTTAGIKESIISFPESPEEQRSIAAVLSSLDDKIELLREQNKTLEATAQTIFQEWFGKYGVDDDKVNAEGREGGLGHLPEGWRIYQMSDLVNVVS